MHVIKDSGFLVQADQPSQLVSHILTHVRKLPQSVDKLNNKQANLEAQREAEEVLARLAAGDPSLHVHSHGHGGKSLLKLMSSRACVNRGDW